MTLTFAFVIVRLMLCHMKPNEFGELWLMSFHVSAELTDNTAGMDNSIWDAIMVAIVYVIHLYDVNALQPRHHEDQCDATHFPMLIEFLCSIRILSWKIDRER